MKRILFMLCLLCGYATANAQTTPELNFQIPVAHSPNWNIPLNYNFNLLDQYLSGEVQSANIGLQYRPIFSSSAPMNASCTATNNGQEYYYNNGVAISIYACNTIAQQWQLLGFSSPTTTLGDLIFQGTSTLTRLGIGTSGQILSVVDGMPAWANNTAFANPMTTIGDLIVGGTAGAATRLPAVATGDCLISNGVATAPSWQTCASGVEGIISNNNGANITIPGTLAVDTGESVSASGLQVTTMDVNTTGEGYGWAYGNDGSSATGWNTTYGSLYSLYSAANGIDQVLNLRLTTSNYGDVSPIYIYGDYYGDGQAASNEGDNTITSQSHEIGYYTATLIGGATIGNTGTLHAPEDLGVTYVFAEATNSGPVTSITANWITAPPVGQVLTIAVQNLTQILNGTFSITSPLIFNLTASGATSQTFVSGTDYSAFSMNQNQRLAVYTATGSAPANVETGCAYYVGAPTADATVYTTCAGSPYLGPAMTAVVASGTYTGSVLLSTTNFNCNGYCDARTGGDFAQGGVLIDTTQVGSSYETTGDVTNVSGLAPYITLETGSVTPSTAWGTIIDSSCSPNGNGQSITQIAVTCNVTLGTSPVSPGPFVTGTNVHVFRNNIQEESPVTAVGSVSGGVQSVTFLTANAWNAGTGVMMQGGPGDQVVIPTAYASSWPVGNWIMGAYASNEIALSTAQGTVTIPGYCSPDPVTLGSSVSYPNGTLSRTSNVVTLANWQQFGNNGCMQVGQTFTLSGATPSDLNGTFTVVSNSNDTYNAAITWAQTGANETGSGTVVTTTPYTSVTLYPGVPIIGNNSSVEGNAQLVPNTVPWTVGDNVAGLPAPVYSGTNVFIITSSNSPSSGSNYGMAIFDQSSDFGSLTDTIWMDSFSSRSEIHIQGSAPYMLEFDDRPESNGSLLYVGGTEVTGTNGKRYDIFRDNNNNGISGTNAGYFDFDPNGGAFIFSGEVQAPSGDFYDTLTLNGVGVCTYNSGTSTAYNCPTANVAPGANDQILQYTSANTIGPAAGGSWYAQGTTFLNNTGGFTANSGNAFSSMDYTPSQHQIEIYAQDGTLQEFLYFYGGPLIFYPNNSNGLQSTMSWATGDWTIGGTNDCSSLFAVGTACDLMADATGDLTLNSLLPKTLYTAAGTPLPACTIATNGARAMVGDATSTTPGTYTSGGTNSAPVFCNYNSSTTTYTWLVY